MIVHLTNSTVAGAAAMLSNAQRAMEHDSICLQLGDIKPARLQFSPDVLPLDLARDLAVDLVRDILSRAKVVHVHNWLPPSIETVVLECLSISHAQLIWHMHQGQFEHPVYRAEAPDMNWDKKLVVAHAFARTFDDFLAVPNCLYRPTVTAAGTLKPVDAAPIDAMPLRVIYSPSSRSGSRWGAKRDAGFDSVIDLVKRSQFMTLIEAEDVNPLELLLLRTQFDVTIDELVTGGFHLVSYEGLFAGNVVINNADMLSLDIFCAALDAPEPPPFQTTSSTGLFDVLYELNQDRTRLQEQKRAGREYFLKYMHPERIVSIFDEIYKM